MGSGINLRFCLSVFVLAGLLGSVSAQTTEERLIGCANIADQEQRYTCFDDLANDVKSKVNSDKTSSQEFGLEHKEMTKGLAETQQAIVKKLTKNAYGAMVLTLENGQVWEQKDTRKMTIHHGDTVLIERGSMSAFYLTAQGNKRMRVARVR